MTVELKSRLWVDHQSEKWTNNRPIKIEAIPLTKRHACPGGISDHAFCFPVVSKLVDPVSGPYLAVASEAGSTGGNVGVSSERGLQYVCPRNV